MGDKKVKSRKNKLRVAKGAKIGEKVTKSCGKGSIVAIVTLVALLVLALPFAIRGLFSGKSDDRNREGKVLGGWIDEEDDEYEYYESDEEHVEEVVKKIRNRIADITAYLRQVLIGLREISFIIKLMMMGCFYRSEGLLVRRMILKTKKLMGVSAEMFLVKKI